MTKTPKNEFEEMEKLKKEFEHLSYILRYVLGELKTPLSVSFLNTEFSSRFKHEINSGITLDFMKIFKDEFRFNVIGADIKVQLKDEQDQPFSKEYHAIADKVKKIFVKDSTKLDDVKRKMLTKKSMLFDQFCKDFSSNKYSINLPLINRNSHKLKLKAEDGQTYVEFSEEDNIFIDEMKFWEIIEAQGFEELVLKILINLFSKFYQDLDQGKLQVCFKYDIAIDRLFMVKHDRYFDRTGQTKYKLKDEYRESSESLAATTASADNLENLLHEMETQETLEGEMQSSNANTDSEDDLVSDTNFTSEDSDIDSDDTLGDEISKESEKDLEEKKKKQWSDQEAARNEDRPGLIRKYSKKKREKYKEVINAMKSGRSVIVSGKSDREPLVIGLSKSPEKRRQQLGDIGVFILKEMQK